MILGFEAADVVVFWEKPDGHCRALLTGSRFGVRRRRLSGLGAGAHRDTPHVRRRRRRAARRRRGHLVHPERRHARRCSHETADHGDGRSRATPPRSCVGRLRHSTRSRPRWSIILVRKAFRQAPVRRSGPSAASRRPNTQQRIGFGDHHRPRAHRRVRSRAGSGPVRADQHGGPNRGAPGARPGRQAARRALVDLHRDRPYPSPARVRQNRHAPASRTGGHGPRCPAERISGTS